MKINTNKMLNYLKQKKWDLVKKNINKNIDFLYLVDSINTIIHYLAYHGKSDIIHKITRILPDLIYEKNIEGDTIAHIAAKLNDTKLLELVIKLTNSKILYIKNNLNISCLFYIIHDTKFIKKLLKNSLINDHFLTPDETFTSYFIFTNDIETTEYILDNVIINNISGRSLFDTIQSELSITDKKKIIRKLINNGVDINVKGDYFITPLILACLEGDTSIVKLLIDLGANIKYYGSEKEYHPLSIAITSENISLIKLLLNKEIDINILDKYSRSPIHYLFINKNDIPLEIKLQILQSVNDTLNYPDENGNTILGLIVMNDDWKKYTKILENHKLDIHHKNKRGQSVYELVDEKQKKSFINMIYKSYINQLTTDIKWEDDIDTKVALLINKKEKTKDIYQHHIIKKIEEDISYPISSNKKIIKLFSFPKTNITHFSGYISDYICYIYNILNKYPEIKIPSMGDHQMVNKTISDFYMEIIDDFKSDDKFDSTLRSFIRDYINHSPILINHFIIWKNNKKYFISPYIIEGIVNTIKKFPDTRFIILKLTLISDNNLKHANIIIFDIINKVIERFDPYGLVPFFDNDSLDDLLRNFFSDYFPKSIYLSPKDILGDNISFQSYSLENDPSNYIENDPNGFCIAWCLWYLEMRINNLDIEPQDLINNLIEKINKTYNFKDYIRDYSNILDQGRNQVLLENGINKKYWYSRNIPNEILRNYYKNIKLKFHTITNH